MENDELVVQEEKDEAEFIPFDLSFAECPESALLVQHRQWLKEIRHEKPSVSFCFGKRNDFVVEIV